MCPQTSGGGGGGMPVRTVASHIFCFCFVLQNYVLYAQENYVLYMFMTVPVHFHTSIRPISR